MRLLIQRVSQASVTVDDAVTGSISHGLLVFVGLGHGDGPQLFPAAADKLANLRIFNDDEGRMNRSLEDVGGALLLVSQFTLYADARKGRRPSYTDAMPPAGAEGTFAAFLDFLRQRHPGRVETGRFGAHMRVEILNDGPVTIWLDSREMGWG